MTIREKIEPAFRAHLEDGESVRYVGAASDLAGCFPRIKYAALLLGSMTCASLVVVLLIGGRAPMIIAWPLWFVITLVLAYSMNRLFGFKNFSIALTNRRLLVAEVKQGFWAVDYNTFQKLNIYDLNTMPRIKTSKSGLNRLIHLGDLHLALAAKGPLAEQHRGLLLELDRYSSSAESHA